MSENNAFLLCIITACFLIIDTYFLELFGVRIAISVLLILIHIAIVLLSISFVGAYILRVIYGCRKVRTKRDKDYLLPLFMEVYEAVIKNTKDANKNIYIYLSEDMSINAYAVGNNTIVVTRGAMELLHEDQLKGIIAHEFAHIVYGDTVVPLILIIGSVWCFPILLLIRAIKVLFRLECYEQQFDKRHILPAFILGFLNTIIFIVTLPFQIIIALNGRYDEYKADRYTARIGFKSELISALYDIRSINGYRRLSPLEALKEAHPDIDKRIEKLEKITLR